MGTAADHGTGHGTGHGIDAVAGYRADRVTVLDHPVAADWLRVLRDRHSDRETFARATAQLTTLVAYEATRDLTRADTCVDTPVRLAAHAHKLVDRLLVVPILRAGLGKADAVCALLPTSAVAHVGLRRDEETLASTVYLNLLPDDLADTTVLVCDPMVATGGSLDQVCALLAARGARSITALCVLAAVPGLARFTAAHPDVRVVCAGLDAVLDDRGYISPGLGDAGDRLFGLRPA